MPYEFLLVFLFLSWAVLLFGGLALGSPHQEDTHRIPIWARMASSAVLVLAAWTWLGEARGQDAHTYAVFIAVGMSLGFLGDLCMARLLPVHPHVLWGMGAFGLGHVAYIGAILRFIDRQSNLRIDWGTWLAWLVVGALLCYGVVLYGQKRTMLHWAALPYALLLASTAGASTGLALQAVPFAPLAVGAVLFLASDLILAAQLFNGLHFRSIGDVIWLTYGPGQALIVLSVWSVLQVGS